MARKIWNIELEGNKHTVELEHGYFSGKREIHVDGKKLEVEKSTLSSVMDTGSHHNFKIGNHECTVLITTTGFSFNYDLLVDQVSQKTGKKITGDLNKLKYGALFFNKIDTREIAEEVIKLDGYTVFGATVFSAILASLLLGNDEGWIDVIISGVLAYWLIKRKSLVAALLLVLLTASIVAVTFTNRVYHPGGGTNILLSVIMFYVALRGLYAAYWLKKQKDK